MLTVWEEYHPTDTEAQHGRLLLQSDPRAGRPTLRGAAGP